MRWITRWICRFNHQNNEFPGETELPPGLWGCNQQADQPGTVCLLCLPVYGESDLDGCTNSSDGWSVFELWWYGFRYVCSCHKTKVEVPFELCRLLSRGHHAPWENVSPGLTLCALSVLVLIILVVVNSCIMFSCLSRNWLFFKSTYFLLTGLFLWPGWPGIAQLCQVLPSSVTRGAWACREVNENAEPEGRKDLPARCQGMSCNLIIEFGCGVQLKTAGVSSLVPHYLTTHNWGGRVYTNDEILYVGFVCCATYLLLTRRRNPVIFELNVKLQRPT